MMIRGLEEGRTPSDLTLYKLSLQNYLKAKSTLYKSFRGIYGYKQPAPGHTLRKRALMATLSTHLWEAIATTAVTTSA